MGDAAAAIGVPVAPADVIYLDIARQAQYNGKKMNKQLKKNVDAACETIQAVWPTIKQ
jgi:hypothetical protein